jgi:hypothetical protein
MTKPQSALLAAAEKFQVFRHNRLKRAVLEAAMRFREGGAETDSEVEIILRRALDIGGGDGMSEHNLSED